MAQFNEAVTYWQALLVYFSYTTFPATEFSILGWGSLIALGCAFGTQVRKPWLRSPVNCTGKRPSSTRPFVITPTSGLVATLRLPLFGAL